jgi:predicted adenylyl cyclase CyaB
MEHEVRFYFPTKKLAKILEKINSLKELSSPGRAFERTIQYEHPCKKFSFYQKSVDGRLRLRETKAQDNLHCKISWKRRLPETTKSTVNAEEEIELTVLPEEIEDVNFLIENVLHLRKVESYERYRTIFENQDVEIAVDEYPFGVALEIEAKKSTKHPTDVVAFWTQKIGLKLEDAFRLSWDDKYRELCQRQGVKQLSHVTFNAKMPEVEDEL